MQKPVMLLILDGWGYREKITSDNAIEQGHTPNWHTLLETCPHCFVETSGYDVGLPEGQMGNSEVGHTNLGAGRVVMQDLPKIDLAIKDGSLEKNPTLAGLIEKLKETKGTCHLMGLMSPGGVHSHQRHIEAVCSILNKNGIPTAVHAFLDGRDTPPQSAKGFLDDFNNYIKELKNVKVATVAGRFYAMDRDKRWDRVEKAYNNIVLADGKRFASADEAITASYNEGVTDEFVVPAVIGDYQGAKDGDAVLMINFRADRAREILYALGDKEFNGFERKKIILFSELVGMVEYSVDHNRFMKTIFAPESLKNIFGEVVANHNLTQLRIAETEKYAHVTFFFNGGIDAPQPHETRVLVASPKVATYDMQPEMSAYEVCDNVLKAIDDTKYQFILVNFANPDMVGHTGVLEAAEKACKVVDECVGKIADACKSHGITMLLTADHGNAEVMQDSETGKPHTAHTTNEVPFILINAPEGTELRETGALCDVAPTVLQLLGIKQPSEMTGKSLIK